MKKIMIVSTVHIWNDTRVYYKEAVSLMKAGFCVEVHAVADFDDIRVEDGIKINPIKREPNRLKRFLLMIEIWIRAKKSNAAVVHFHDPELLPVMYLIKKMLKVKVIYDVHEDVPADILTKEWIPEVIRQPLSRFVNKVEKFVSKHMDALLFAEKYYKENFTSVQNVLKEDILNYPILTNDTEHNKEYEKSHDVIRLVYAGGLSRSRGLFEMVDGFLAVSKMCPEHIIELYLIGPISDVDRIKVEEKVLANELGHRLHVTGRIPHSKVFEYLRKSDIGFSILHPEPNFIKSLATKLFEYMSAGLPYIASNFEYWNQITQTEQCGISVNPEDQNEINDALFYLISNPEARKKLGDNGKRASQKYSWMNEEKKLINVYNNLLAIGGD